MSKVKRLMILAFLPLLLLLSFGQLAKVYGAEETTVVLHKRLFREVHQPNENLYSNDGLLIEGDDEDTTLLKETFGLNGANFTVYDASEFYQNSEMNAETFVRTYSQELSRKDALALIKKEQMLKIASVQTRNDWNSAAADTKEDGITRVNLPSAEKRAYLFIEEANDATSGVNIDLEKSALPMMLVFPQRHPVSGEILSEIHLYPKNVGYVRNPYFFKYGKDKTTGIEGALAEAKFVLYQLDDQGQKHYLAQSEPENFQNRWLTSPNPVTDENLVVFSSDKNGLVDTKERFLPAGEYYFEEIQTATGYQINSAAKKIKVEIPKSWQDGAGNFLSVMINGQPMEELVAGVIPQSVYEAATPRVYNYKETPVTPLNPDPGQRKPGMTLPQTGMRKETSTIVGLLVIFSVVGYWVKTKEKGNGK